MNPPNGPNARALGTAMLVACALGPACLAAAQVANVADAAHDAGVARVLGLAPAPWHGLDALAGALFANLPLGTSAERAALGSALMLGAAGVTLFAIVQRLLAACAETERLGFVVAALATSAPLLGPPWQIETAAVGGSVIGGLVVLFAVAMAARATPHVRGSWPWAAAALGVALGYDPLTGACAFCGCAALVLPRAQARAALVQAWHGEARSVVTAFLAGLAPFFLAVAHARSAGAPLATSLFDASGEGRTLAPSSANALRHFVYDEVGLVLVLLAIAGTALALLVPRARSLTASLLAVAVSGMATAWLGAPLGPTRYGGPVLAALAATFALAAVAMQAIVRAVAAAPVPFARASAAMVVVLELVWPVDAADEALVRTRARGAAPASAWDDAVWGALPPNALVLASDPSVQARAAAARAEGELRGDLVVVSADAHRAFEWRVFANDATFVPLWRDLALGGTPTEASLSSLTRTRPVVMAYEPRWGYAIGRHLIPLALLDRFEPEPRGASDRRRALDAFAAQRQQMAAATEGEPELSVASAALLHARALVIGEGADRDLTERALADWRAFVR